MEDGPAGQGRRPAGWGNDKLQALGRQARRPSDPQTRKRRGGRPEAGGGEEGDGAQGGAGGTMRWQGRHRVDEGGCAGNGDGPTIELGFQIVGAAAASSSDEFSWYRR
jgi:hypothetical protein